MPPLPPPSPPPPSPPPGLPPLPPFLPPLPPSYCYPKFGKGDCSEHSFCGARLGRGACDGGRCRCTPGFCGYDCSGVVLCHVWDPVHSNWTQSGVATLSPALGSPATDGQLRCAGHGISALGFAGLCVHGLLDDGTNASSVNASALLPLIPTTPLDELPFGALVATVVISTSTALNVLTVRWARQARQRRLPIEERDPVWMPIVCHWLSRTTVVTVRIARDALTLVVTSSIKWVLALSSLAAFSQHQLRRRAGTTVALLAGRCLVQAKVCVMALLLGTFAAVAMLARVIARGALSCRALVIAARTIPLMGRFAWTVASGASSFVKHSCVAAFDRACKLAVTFSALGRLAQLVSRGVLARARSRNWRAYLQLRVPVIELPPTVKVALFTSTRLLGRLQSRAVDVVRQSTLAVLLVHVSSRLVGFASQRWFGLQVVACWRALARAALYVRTGSPTPRLACFVVVELAKRSIARILASIRSAHSYLRSACFSARASVFVGVQCARRLCLFAMATASSIFQAARTVAVGAKVSRMAFAGCITRNAGRFHAGLVRCALTIRHLGASAGLARFAALLLSMRMIGRSLASAQRVSLWVQSSAVVPQLARFAAVQACLRWLAHTLSVAQRVSLWVQSSAVVPQLARFAAVQACLRWLAHAVSVGRWVQLRLRGAVDAVGLSAYVLASLYSRQAARVYAALERTAIFVIFTVALRKIVAFVLSSWLYRWTIGPAVR